MLLSYSIVKDLQPYRVLAFHQFTPCILTTVRVSFFLVSEK